MFHISNGDDRWRVVRERKVGDAVFFFTEQAWSGTKEVKMVENMVF